MSRVRARSRTTTPPTNSEGFSLTLSQFLNNNRSKGSGDLGNLLTLPVGGGMLYVQPIYVSSQSRQLVPAGRAIVVGLR
jgi:uncharacterized membrane protein (UPF0182 family)